MYRQLTLGLTNVIKSTFGQTCSYYQVSTDSIISDLQITINKNKPHKDEAGNIIAYGVYAIIDKTDLPQRPDNGDYITDEQGDRWNCLSVTRDNTSTWYVNLEYRG